MITGYLRDGFPRVTLTLPGQGGTVDVEFVVDTAFAGGLAVPASLVARLNARFVKQELISLADGSYIRSPMLTLDLNWEGDLRRVEVSVLQGSNSSPLLGVALLAEMLLTVEMTDGGDVSVEAM